MQNEMSEFVGWDQRILFDKA